MLVATSMYLTQLLVSGPMTSAQVWEQIGGGGGGLM